MAPTELDEGREAAHRDAESVKRHTPRIRLLNMPPHRDLGGERGSERGEAGQAGKQPNPIQPRPEWLPRESLAWPNSRSSAASGPASRGPGQTPERHSWFAGSPARAW